MDVGLESREAFQVAYIGDDSHDHTMDVEALAPALLGYSDMIRAANAEVNKDKASIRVVVASHFEHKCFNINFEVIQTVIQSIKDFLDDKTIEDAKEILTKLGLLAGPATAVLGYLKWKKGRKVESITQVTDSPNTVIVKVEGDNNTIHLSNDVLRIAESEPVLEAVEETLRPIEAKEANGIEFRRDDHVEAVLGKEDVRDIIRSCEAGPVPPAILEDPEKKPKTVTGTLYAYGPVFDTKAPMWRFLYRGKPIYADIRETDIAKDAVNRGGSFMNDRYLVKMEVTAPEREDGTPHYKIVDVLEFTPAERQMNLPLRKRKMKRSRKRAS
jgi:hypothetical protein